jgi:hypothetical protein
MQDIKAAYGTDVPLGPGKCQGKVIALLSDGPREMWIFGRWYEGRRERFNLVAFDNQPFGHVARGLSDEYVQIIE